MTKVGDNLAIERRIEAAKNAVLAETSLLHREFGRARSEIKHDGTLVTPVDIEISQNIIQALVASFSPEDQFFSEELVPLDTTIPVISRFCWVLDPIDGTNNYASGIIYCAISLALLEHGFPVYGVIYDMARKVLIHGGVGRGVWDGERQVKVNAGPPNDVSLVGFHSPVQKNRAEDGKRIIESFKVRGLGSSTLHLAYAAIGLLDGVVEYNNKIWDMAAAAALAEEAGAEVFYLSPSPFPLKEFTLYAPLVQYVCGNPAMVHRLREVVQC